MVPAFEASGGFQIPDRRQCEWIMTNPRVHAEKATSANMAFDRKWKPVVKMIKKWNDNNHRPIKPSFLIEVMSLELLIPPWGGSYPRELRQFFSTAVSAMDETWEDPAGVGPPVTARAAANPAEREGAKRALQGAERSCTAAIQLEQGGRIGAALDAWQELFGRHFAKS